MDALSGYWPSIWPAEDGGPRRQQVPNGGPPLAVGPGDRLEVTQRQSMVQTMLVHRDPGQLAARYRTIDGQTYGWDAVLADGAAWFLDGGEGSEAYAGTFRGKGISPAPLHLVRVGLADGRVDLAEVCGKPGGLIANPPVVDVARGIAVGFDSANRTLTAFDRDLAVRWQRTQDHGSHMLLYPETGELVTFDHEPDRGGEDVVVLDITTGDERARAATGSPVQGVLFPAPGLDRDLYAVTFTTVSRIAVVS